MSSQLSSRTTDCRTRPTSFLVSRHAAVSRIACLQLVLALAAVIQTPTQAKAAVASVPALPPPGGAPGSQQYCTDLDNSLSTLQKAYDALPPAEKNDDQTQENYNKAGSGLKYDWTVHGCGGVVKPSGCTDQNLCPPDSPPTTSGAPFNLGGIVNIPSSAFDLGSAPRKPILTKPFTAGELLAIAPPGRIQTGTLGQFVKNKAGKLIPLSTYVAQLNGMEKFLNGYGYTLRDGVLAGSTSTKVLTEKLGLQFKLRSLQAPTNALNERTVATTPFPPYLPTIPYTRQKQPEYINFSPANLRQMLIQEPHQIDVSGYTFAPRVLQLATGIVPSDPPRLAPDSIVPQDNQCPVSEGSDCGLILGSNVTLSGYGQAVIDLCDVGGNCQWDSLEYGFAEHILLLMLNDDGLSALDIADFVENHMDPCTVVKVLGLQTASLLYNMDVNYTSGDNHGTTSTQGTAAPNFFDGVLEVETNRWHACENTNGGLKDWFGGAVCLAYDSKNYYHPGTGFDILESAGVSAHASLFGVPFTLLDGASTTEWKQNIGVANSQTVTNPWTKTSLNPTQNGEQFDGPAAYFTIGPVPFSIKSSLYAGITVGDTNTTFVAPPLSKNKTGSGDIGVKISAEANATVTISAGVDIGVASAGVYGALMLFDHKVDSGIDSVINPIANSLFVNRSTDWTLNSMNGELGAYVEVDLLVYSKRWEVELAHYDGFTETVPVGDYTAGPYSAKIPATAKQSCN